MKDFDELIGRALTDEDRALLARHGEPGYFTQALGLFRGPSAWVMWVLYATTLVAFAGALAALWQTWHATDAVVAYSTHITHADGPRNRPSACVK